MKCCAWLVLSLFSNHFKWSLCHLYVPMLPISTLKKTTQESAGINDRQSEIHVWLIIYINDTNNHLDFITLYFQAWWGVRHYGGVEPSWDKMPHHQSQTIWGLWTSWVRRNGNSPELSDTCEVETSFATKPLHLFLSPSPHTLHSGGDGQMWSRLTTEKHRGRCQFT